MDSAREKRGEIRFRRRSRCLRYQNENGAAPSPKCETAASSDGASSDAPTGGSSAKVPRAVYNQTWLAKSPSASSPQSYIRHGFVTGRVQLENSGEVGRGGRGSDLPARLVQLVLCETPILRCQAMTVSGLRMSSVDGKSLHSRESQNPRTRSVQARRSLWPRLERCRSRS